VEGDLLPTRTTRGYCAGYAAIWIRVPAEPGSMGQGESASIAHMSAGLSKEGADAGMRRGKAEASLE
jgi:hypothetical protein